MSEKLSDPESILVTAQLNASLEEVEQFCVKIKGLMDRIASSSDTMAVELLTREALNNAVIHGSQSDPEQKIDCRVRIKDRKAVILVKDKGQGFDSRNIYKAMREGIPTFGTGLKMCAMFADKIRFNKRGNKVFLLKQLSPIHCDVSKEIE